MIRHTREEKPNTFSFVTCGETRQIPAGKARDARGDYFLNFSSLTEIPVGRGSSSRDSRHTARKRRADFFRLRNNLYGQCTCTRTSRETKKERERERKRERKLFLRDVALELELNIILLIARLRLLGMS